jgi:hypothetical protein
MAKSTCLLLLMLFPLMLMLPLIAHAETLHCKTELLRLCDVNQSCTRTTALDPVPLYEVDLSRDMRSASIRKFLGSKRAASWRVRLDAEDEQNRYYIKRGDASSRLALSRSMSTFSYESVFLQDKKPMVQKEIGLCSNSAR